MTQLAQVAQQTFTGMQQDGAASSQAMGLDWQQAVDQRFVPGLALINTKYTTTTQGMQTAFKGAGDQVSGAFTKMQKDGTETSQALGQDWQRAVDYQFLPGMTMVSDGFETTTQGMQTSFAGLNTYLDSGLHQTFDLLFQGKIDGIGQVWETTLSGMTSYFSTWASDFVYQFANAGIKDLFGSIFGSGTDGKPLEGLEGLINGIFGGLGGGNAGGGSLGGLGNLDLVGILGKALLSPEKVSDFIAALEMGDSIAEALEASGLAGGESLVSGIIDGVTDLGGEVIDLVSGLFSSSSAAAGAGTMASVSEIAAIGADFAAITSEIGAVSAGTMASASEIAALGADFAAINAEIGITSSAGFAGLGAAASTGLAAAGMLAVGEIFSQWLAGGSITEGLMTSFQKGFEGIGDIISGDFGKQTPEEARYRIGANLNLLGDLGSGETLLDGTSLASVADFQMQLETLAETAGLTSEQMQTLLGALDPQAAAVLEAAEAYREGLHPALQDLTLVQQEGFLAAADYSGQLLQYTNGAYQAGVVTADVATILRDAAAAAGEAAGPADELTRHYLDLAIATLMSGRELEDGLLFNLSEAQKEALNAALEAQGLADAIAGIPNEKHVNVYFHEHHTQEGGGAVGEEMHTGGLVRRFHGGGHLAGYWQAWERYHTGALVSRLAQDEVPIIARRGEFVVRAESVNSGTLPHLRALNQTGRVGAPAGPALVINAPLVHIEGNLIGSEQAKDDLAREIEVRLGRLASARFAA